MQVRQTILGGTAGEINALALFPSEKTSAWDWSGRVPSLPEDEPKMVQEGFDWEKCVADFDDAQVQQLAEWRGYAVEFCRWLHSNSLVGLCNGKIALPVFDNDQRVIACHWRKDAKIWFYHPTGHKTTPLVLGNRCAQEIWAFESQWDAFAIMDRLGWHTDANLRHRVAVVITRGAGNGKLIAGLCRPDSRVYAFMQNDAKNAIGGFPAESWLAGVVSHAGCPVALVRIPTEFKDANDWTRAGATEANILAAIKASEPQSAPNERVATTDQNAFVVLPGHDVSILECAEKLFPIMAASETLFSRNGTVMESSVLKSRITLKPVGPQAFRSRIEQYGQCLIKRAGANGEMVLKPTIPTADAASGLLESPAVNKLPPITGLVNAPVLIADGAQCRIVERGYDRGSGLIVVGGGVSYPIAMEEAVNSLHEVFSEFDFKTAADRSRALAALITPALRFGGHIHGSIPIDLAEADEPQSGKTFRIKCTAAVYNEIPSMITQKKGGVGSDEETFDSALIAGRPFILFDNRRGKFDSPHLEAFITAQGLFPARIPYQKPVLIDPDFFILAVTSNGLETTPDLAKRSAIVRIRKRSGHKFKKYPEGNLLGHLIAEQPYYLGCVFSVVQAWLEAGKPRTDETRHDFQEWSQSLDWIVRNIFKSAPLMDDHESAQRRVSSPGLSFVRQIALAVEANGSLNEELTCTAIYNMASDRGIEIPTLRPGDPLAGARTIGTQLGKLFTPEVDVAEEEGFKIERLQVKKPRDDGKGVRDQNRFIFSRTGVPASPLP